MVYVNMFDFPCLFGVVIPTMSRVGCKVGATNRIVFTNLNIGHDICMSSFLAKHMFCTNQQQVQIQCQRFGGESFENITMIKNPNYLYRYALNCYSHSMIKFSSGDLQNPFMTRATRALANSGFLCKSIHRRRWKCLHCRRWTSWDGRVTTVT